MNFLFLEWDSKYKMISRNAFFPFKIYFLVHGNILHIVCQMANFKKNLFDVVPFEYFQAWSWNIVFFF